MSAQSVIAAAGALTGNPVVAAVAGGGGVVKSVVSALNPGAARDAARVHRRDFFLNAAKAGSVTGARYLLGGLVNVAGNERRTYDDGVRELQGGPALWQETLSRARNLGPLWPVGLSADAGVEKAGNEIAAELGQLLNVPSDAANVSQQSAIEGWAKQFQFNIRRDAAQSIAQAAAGIGTSAAGSVAPKGSSKPLLIPTNAGMLAVVGVLVLGLGYLALRRR